MLKVAIQMNQVSTLNLKGDTSLLLAFGALQRGHKVSFFLPETLSYRGGRLSAKAASLGVEIHNDSFAVSEGEAKSLDIADCDVVLIRQDPPFDMTYITNTFLLERISDKTLVLNSPEGLRNRSEKLMCLDFEDQSPATLITRDVSEAKAFLENHKTIIVKPLYEFGGAGVHKITELSALERILSEDKTGLPQVLQPYLAEVVKGDKRLILFDGELIGGFSRVPEKGSVLSNMAQGAEPVATELTEHDKKICEKVGPYLKEHGLFFAGLDVIGDKLIEINVTSPTGLVPLNKLSGIQSEQIFWQKVESIVRNKGQNGCQYYNSRVSRGRGSTH